MDGLSVAAGRSASDQRAVDSQRGRPMTGEDRTPERVDDVFVQLSHPRRRAVMLLVAAAGGRGVDLRTAASTLYALEHEITPRDSSTRAVTNLRTNLKRSHLPQLTAAGLLTYKKEAEQVTAGPAFGVALQVLFSAGYWLGTAHQQHRGETQHSDDRR